MENKINWKDVTLYEDTEKGYSQSYPEPEFIKNMQGYKRNGEITQLYLVPSDSEPPYGVKIDHDKDDVWDTYHDKWCPQYMAGPTPEEIDWTGLPEDEA